MAYFHGIKNTEIPTKLVPSIELESGLVFAVGTAPIHLATEPAETNAPVLCYDLSEYVSKFGYTGNFDAYTLDEVTSSQYQLSGVSPTVFVNVLDKSKHYNEVSKELGGVSENSTIIQSEMFLDTLEVKSVGNLTDVDLTENTDYTAETNINTDSDTYLTIDLVVDANLPSDDLKISYDLNGSTTTVTKSVTDLPFDLPVGASNVSVAALVTPENILTVNEDFTAAYNSDGDVVFTILDDTKIFNDKVQIKYHESAPEKVTTADIIGGYDLVTGKNTGLETIEDVFPKFRLTVGIIIAPKFSTDVTVAAAMKAKTTGINSVFNAIACVDIPTDEVKTYTAAAEYKNLKNLVDTSLIVCYPKISLGGVQYHLSTQLASLMNKVDSEKGDGIPYISPSNKNLQMDSAVLADGTEVFLSLDKASYLNGQGIVTALNFANGWTAYGNRTSIYPSSTDPKEAFINIRRSFYWLRNTLTLTYFSKIDNPMNKRFIHSVLDSVNIFLNGLTARGILNGGRIEFIEGENPTTDLMDGITKFHLYLNVPSPARVIEFTLEYDSDYLANLFS